MESTWVWEPTTRTTTVSAAVWSSTSMYSLAGVSARSSSTLPSCTSWAAWATPAGSRCSSSSSSLAGSPHTAPMATAYLGPVNSVPGIPTTKAFLMILAEARRIMRSMAPEVCARAVAPAKAMATGSVQPVATFIPAAIASRSTCIVC